MTNKNKSSPREKWTIDQTIVAFYFYCQTPFGKLHSTNPKIIELASFIGRTPSAFAMKCVNFASLDPAILKSGRSGLSNASRLDKEIWEEFHSDGQALIEKAEKLLENFKRDKKLELISEFMQERDFTGEVRLVTIKQRIGQSFFRNSVLSSYNGKCCISGVRDARFLVASHIVAWKDDVSNRLNPANGLCLSSIHDKAFDHHLFSLTDDFEIILSRQLKETRDQFLKDVFWNLEGRQITLPEKFIPDIKLIKAHRNQLKV